MEMPHSTEEGRRDVQAGPWGLGDRRTLDDFIEFTGVSGLFSLYGVLFVAFVFFVFYVGARSRIPRSCLRVTYNAHERTAVHDVVRFW